MIRRLNCITCVALAFAAAGCSKPAVEEVATTAAAPVSVVTVTPGTLEGIVSATGVVAAAPGADLTITAPEPARIVELPKAEGDRVKPGDLLVRFEIPSLSTDVSTRRAEVQQAQAKVENAEASVKRLTTLVEHGVAAQKELEDARRELAEAHAARAQAQSASQNAGVLAARTVVRARFAGVIAKRAHNPGDMVEASASDVILRVIDPSRLQVVASVAIPDLARVQVGKPVRILVPGSGDSETGKVLTRPAAVDPAGVSADVRIAFDGTTRLAAGTPVRTEIVAERRAGAIAVPVEALLTEAEETFVMVVVGEKAQKRKVAVGLKTPRQAEITSGLKAGEQVVVKGQQGLPDGASIAIAK
ncbi:MAG TPA: efflux RND transporter periplasmic adaptor subunit [Vicinamibacterales bacterium]|nr:efflux RND transporter periplasmic adaptor subunit [Vicinamibacterales bacterium]